MKIAFCGGWHVHKNNIAQKALDNGCEIIGIYEPNPVWRDAFKERFSTASFDTLDELLQSDAECVVVCSSTDKHCEHIVAIANAGKNIFTEKVLALSIEECEKIKEAVEKNGVDFTICYSQKYVAGIKKVKEIADSGELGRINHIRFRMCHSGSVDNWLPEHFYNKKECGGGAMIDLGAHGMYIINWFLGMPSKYMSAFEIWDSNAKNKDGIEDNASIMMVYPDGTIAINETGFVSGVGISMLEVVGDKGYAVYDYTDKVVKNTVSTDKKAEQIAITEEPSLMDRYFAGEKITGCGIEEAIALTQMMVESGSVR